MNKPFEFQTTIANMSTTRSLEYRFYAEGHEMPVGNPIGRGNVTVKLKVPSFQMNVSVEGNGSISSNDIYQIDCPKAKCEASVPSGTSLTLTAAQQGSTFTKWDCTGTTSTTNLLINPLIVTMDTSKSCKAIFTTPTTPPDVASCTPVCQKDVDKCGIKATVQKSCQTNPASCDIAPTEQSTFGNDLKLIIPSVKSEGIIFQPVEMSLFGDGWITEDGKGRYAFQIDKLVAPPSIPLSENNASAKGVLRIIGDIAVSVATKSGGESLPSCDGQPKPSCCNDDDKLKLCKSKLDSVVQISAKNPIPTGSTIDFKGDCEKVNNTCEVTINKPYQVVVVSTSAPTITPPTVTPPKVEYVTLSVETADKSNVEGTVELTGDGKTQKCAGVKLNCSYQYPKDTKVAVKLTPGGTFTLDQSPTLNATSVDMSLVDKGKSERIMSITFTSP